MDKRRLGKCYELAGREMVDTDRPNARLVHGTIGYEELNPHAWLEFDDIFTWPDGRAEVIRMAWEPVLKYSLPVDAYYRLFQVEIHHQYDQDEIRKWMLKAKHWGPWEGVYWKVEKQGRQKKVKRA